MVGGPTGCSSPAEPASSPPPRSVSSGTTTNPNTPRPSQEPDVEDENELAQDLGHASPDRPPTEAESIATTPTNPRNSPSPSPSPKSSSSGAPSLGHIEPTWPKKIDLTKISALASWGKGQTLPGLLFDLHWVPPSNKAFLELRASVQLKHAPGRRRDGRTSVYLHIYPERITQLTLDASPADKMLGHDTVALAFTLSRPPVLVVPPTGEFEPRNKASGDIITALFDLARQTAWTVYAAVPPRSLSAARLRKLCEAVSEPLAGSIAALAGAATLYQGQGGKIVEGDSLGGGESGTTGHGHEVQHDDPPEYEESGSAPVYHPSPDKGKKRLRRGSTPETSREQKQPAPAADMDSLLESRLSALEQRLGDALAAHRKEMVELVGQAEARILETLRREMGQQAAEAEEALGRRVAEEVGELEETVMRNISEAPLRATLTFPQHPWY
ncbi:hypothetical protein KVR01_008164 [Diaporthe batatas]|uniref:uncharacterized protein n=1 Tax=Diaporthe batatas TaxID=748121 RepID=UPI001D0555D4|nr:uncharacterized protein KVR01_008164 [Diaporthe batatas]KAG8162399.1 hypothetical protein KVR01_008164 [Diaporthe batatas]